MNIRTLALSACTIGYAEWTPDAPNGETVICAHGLSRQKRDFDYLAQYLATNGYRVLCVDAPGRGDSSWFPTAEDYTLANYAKAFIEFIETLRLPEVHWIGSSMGGLIAMAIAEEGRADLFKTVTLVDVTHRPNDAACKRISDYIGERVPIMANVEQLVGITKITLPLGDVSEDVWRHFAAHQLVKTDKGYEFHFDTKIAPLAKKDLANGIDHTDGLVNIACPIALVAGAVSDLCGPAEIDDLLALKPGTPVHRVPHAGHIPSLSDADTQAFILDFLHRHPD